MTKKITFYASLLFIFCVGLAACGEDADNTDDTEEGTSIDPADCPRLEMEELEDCTFEDRVTFNEKEKVEAFCESPCKRLLSIGGTGPQTQVKDMTLFARVDRLEGGVSLDDIETLESLDGFDDITHIEQSMTLRGNESLQSIAALGSVKSIGMGGNHDLHLYNNNALETLEGLESLEEIGNAVVLDQNSSLKDISALENLETVENIKITDNAALPTCHAQAVVDRIDPPGTVLIQGNGSGSCD